jgi:hypothetical protein
MKESEHRFGFFERLVVSPWLVPALLGSKGNL